MIYIPILSYSENRFLDFEITGFINAVLADILRCAVDNHEKSKRFDGCIKSDVLEDISPSAMLREDPRKCEDTFYELMELVESHTTRFRIHPRYYFFLYQCIDWYIDVYDDLSRTVPEPLRSKVLKAYDDEMIEVMENVTDYPEICFTDLDFLPDSLSDIVSLYLDGSAAFDSLMTQEELDNFTELMAADQREDYLAVRQKMDRTETTQFQCSRFTHDLKKALLQIQKNKRYWNAPEDELNMALRDRLAMLYETHDQTMQGRSETGIRSGEVDLLILHNDVPAAIIEPLKLCSLDKAYLKKHIDKTLVNYDPNGLAYAYIVVYSAAPDFEKFCRALGEYLRQYEYPYPVLEEIQFLPTGYAELAQAVTVLERNHMPVYLQYLVVNLNFQSANCS